MLPGALFCFLTALAALALAGIACASGLSWRRRFLEVDADLAALRRELERVASSSARTGLRVERMERAQGAVFDRVEELETRPSAAPAFDEAIARARHGADTAYLAGQLGLSPSEAELVVRLHGRARRI